MPIDPEHLLYLLPLTWTKTYQPANLARGKKRGEERRQKNLWHKWEKIQRKRIGLKESRIKRKVGIWRIVPRLETGTEFLHHSPNTNTHRHTTQRHTHTHTHRQGQSLWRNFYLEKVHLPGWAQVVADLSVHQSSSQEAQIQHIWSLASDHTRAQFN